MPDDVCDKCRPVVERLEKEVKELRTYVQALEAQLRRFMNPHTPPSLTRSYKKHHADGS